MCIGEFCFIFVVGTVEMFFDVHCQHLAYHHVGKFQGLEWEQQQCLREEAQLTL